MGLALSALSQSFPPKSHFTVDDIPDLTGKVVIVTGANSGIGKETAKSLLAHNARVYIAARDEGKADLAIKDLKDQTGKESFFLRLDLADLHSVKAAAKEFASKEKELHILFNNAGVMFPPVEMVTAQGYDLQFGTNVLGHFYFTKLLMPLLLLGSKSSPDGKARVINLSSTGHLTGSLNFNTFKDGPARRRCFTVQLYAQSKFGNIVFANELARRYGHQGIVSSSVHPGTINTNLHRSIPGFLISLADYIVMYPASQGAVTSLWAGTSAEGADLGGKYLVPWARIGPSRAGTRDPEVGRQFWEWAEEQVNNL